MAEQFKVDLRGIVDILSHHLYSSEQVYLREVLQNAHDAILARRREDPSHAGRVTITPAVGSEPMIVRDDGIGLTDEEMRSLLATIGGSSKRDDFAAARRKFLGQFGIGLLSCFLVADTIEIRSRSARTPDAPTILWVGRSDGTFAISQAEEALDAPGTEMRLAPRHGMAEWVQEERVRALAREYAEFLDVGVHIGDELVSENTPPWLLDVEGQVAWCRERLGFEPMGIVDVDARMLNVRGLAFVLPYTAAPGHRTGDRVYSRGMLVADTDDRLLPGWAFFCRAVIDAGDLPLTASREALQESAALQIAREQVGRRVLGQLITVSATHPEVYQDILRLHATGLKALAADGVDLRDLIRSTMPMRTSQGQMTIEEMIDTGRPVGYVTRGDKFDAMTDIALHAGALLVDASGAHDATLLETISSTQPEAQFRQVDVDALVEMVSPAPAEDTDAADDLVRRAGEVLPDVDVQVRSFEPSVRAALWWPTTATLEGDVVSSAPSDRPSLVLNAHHPAVARLLSRSLPPEAERSALVAFNVAAQLQARASVSVADAEGLVGGLSGLIDAVPQP